MKRFAGKLEDPSPFILLELTSRLDEFQTIATDFSSTVVPELRSAVDQCGTPTKFATAFAGFLEEEGMTESVLSWVEDIATTMEALSEQS